MTERKPWDHGGRESAAKRGYGYKHRKLREQLFRREPLCRACAAKGRTTIATIADHIQPLAKGGAAHDLSNMQPLCPACHQDKSNADKGHRVKPNTGLDGWPEG